MLAFLGNCLFVAGASVLLGFMYGFLKGMWNDFRDRRAGRRCIEYHNVDGNRIKTWRENGDWFARKVN